MNEEKLREGWRQFYQELYKGQSLINTNTIADWWLSKLTASRQQLGNDIILHFGAFLPIGQHEAESIEALAALVKQVMRPKFDDDELRSQIFEQLVAAMPKEKPAYENWEEAKNEVIREALAVIRSVVLGDSEGTLLEKQKYLFQGITISICQAIREQ